MNILSFGDFVQITDANERLFVLSISQIVFFQQQKGSWLVKCTGGLEITLKEDDGNKLIAKLPGTPKAAGTI